MAEDQRRSWSNLSRLTKCLLVSQSVIIIGLSVWLYNEYRNNQYLQSYLARALQGQGSIIALVGLGGILAVGFVGILLKAGNILGEIEEISSDVKQRSSSAPLIDPPKQSMPVLERVDPQPTDEISRIHGSMRRWNERSRTQD